MPTEPKEFRWRLGSRIRWTREGKGWTQRQFAKAAGLSVSFVSDLEAGKRGPSAWTVLLVCDALGIKPGKLLDGLDPAELA